MSELFRDGEAERKLLDVMESNPSGMWNVSQFVRTTGLARPRVDRAVIALEVSRRICADIVGKSKVIRLLQDGAGPTSPSRSVERASDRARPRGA